MRDQGAEYGSSGVAAMHGALTLAVWDSNWLLDGRGRLIALSKRLSSLWFKRAVIFSTRAVRRPQSVCDVQVTAGGPKDSSSPRAAKIGRRRQALFARISRKQRGAACWLWACDEQADERARTTAAMMMICLWQLCMYVYTLPHSTRHTCNSMFRPMAG